jgi:hypothetical protein
MVRKKSRQRLRERISRAPLEATSQVRSVWLFTYVSIEDRTSDNHPMLRIRWLMNQALDRLSHTF